MAERKKMGRPKGVRPRSAAQLNLLWVQANMDKKREDLVSPREGALSMWDWAHENKNEFYKRVLAVPSTQEKVEEANASDQGLDALLAELEQDWANAR